MSDAPQHGGLTAERWATFSFDQQVLMVGNEMNRATQLLQAEDWERARRGYERVLRLVDLTAITTTSAARRREILRWREVIAELYLEDRPPLPAHSAAFRCLLQLAPAAAAQVPLLVGDTTPPGAYSSAR